MHLLFTQVVNIFLTLILDSDNKAVILFKVTPTVCDYMKACDEIFLQYSLKKKSLKAKEPKLLIIIFCPYSNFKEKLQRLGLFF